MDKIIVKICGGLGNQMFQYAAARALSLYNNCEFKLDISWFENMEGCTHRDFLLPYFTNCKINIASKREIIQYRFDSENIFQRIYRKCRRYQRKLSPIVLKEKQYVFDSSFYDAKIPVYLDGYWQSEEYFKRYRKEICKDFRFSPLPECAHDIASRIMREKNSIAVHIRRGDYVNNETTNKLHGTCSDYYYESSIKYFSKLFKNIKMFIFSDDQEWCRKKFKDSNIPLEFINIFQEKNCYYDLHLMALCRHHIIANSSFSWWGAWLSFNDGTVCAPKIWFAGNPEKGTPVLKSWIMV